MTTLQSPIARDFHGQVMGEPALPPPDNPETAEQRGDDEARFHEADHIQETETPNTATKILYRYLVKEENGDIIEKKESADPIVVKVDDKATGLTDQTVLEVLTTQTVIKTLDRIDHRYRPYTVLKIHSLHLINALREVIRYYPSLNFSSVPVTIPEPFMPLVHYMKELEDYKMNHPQGHNEDFILTTNSHIDVLLGFLNQRLGQELRLERERHMRQPPVATYEFLWLLFRPGEIFVLPPNKEEDDDEERHPYIIGVMRPHFEAMTGYEFLIWRIDIIFSRLGPYHETRNISPFEGEKEISSLKMCPRAFLPDYCQAKEKFIARGMKFVGLFEPSYMEHTGTTQSLPSFEINGKIMVDPQSWIRFSIASKDHQIERDRIWAEFSKYDFEMFLGSGCECTVCDQIVGIVEPILPIRDFWYPWRDNSEKILNDDFYLLCSPVVRGYALNERKWVNFHIDQVSEPEIDPDPFSNLVLENEIKDTIEALVCNYAQRDSKVESWSKDFVRDKGEGRIFLLHGSPGVGKTCTAECVADLIKRPLLPLTCGDMGVTASEVESNFNLFFELGERWGAVVLMDEADIYLEQRTSENLERNSLVSVFLRSLEYFRGVLFLTTNRVGSFDDAFISRIHVALHYKRLTDDYRAKIWEKNFNRLGKEDSMSIAPGAIIYVTTDPDARAVEWNGREIRNAFQTAVALAQYQARKEGKEKVVLQADHLKRVVKMSRLFKDYIDSTHKNQDEAKRAIIEERRNDAFDSLQPSKGGIN